MTEQMSEQEKEAREIFDGFSELIDGKPMTIVLSVIINVIRRCLDNANPQQKQMIMITLLENLGVGDDSDPETTLQ